MTQHLTARAATHADAPRIAKIYNQGIADRVATFETQPRTVETIRGWIDADWPVVVVEANGDVVAWANTSLYRPRECYARNAEFSVYVDRAWRGRGAGKVAMRELIDAAREQGLEKLISRVFPENRGSLRLLAGLGFREVGRYRRHARLDGVWRDVVIVELLLQDHDGEPEGALWQPDPATLDLWPAVQPGLVITVEKLPWEPDRDGVRYDALVVESPVAAPWVEVRARWTLGRADVGGLTFEQGDELCEFFSPRHPFNVFAVYRQDGAFKGWYGNVTRTARLRPAGDGLMLTWPDLVLDLVMLPDGTAVDLDDDELAASGIPEREPDLARQMVAARDEVRRLLQAGYFPTR